MDEAEKLSDTLHIVDHGRVVASGTVADLVPAGRSLEDIFLDLTGRDIR
jgi:ABC-2 type transport system ATP-binding protein